MRLVKFSYFGYTATFPYAGDDTAARAEANRLVADHYGPAPSLSYVEPAVPFPSYVPCLTWDETAGAFYP